jgi:hypothetical protein
MKKKFNTNAFLFNVILLSNLCSAQGTTFKQAATFQTKGEATMVRNDGNTLSIEKKHIPIPEFIDLTASSEFAGLSHDSESGWTKCRYRLKDEIVFPRVSGKVLVFDCKPLTYF